MWYTLLPLPSVGVSQNIDLGMKILLTTNDISSGIICMASIGARIRFEKQPGISIATLSPTLYEETDLPTRRIMPAPSCPRRNWFAGTMPSTIAMSLSKSRPSQ